ncbi:MAG: EAL domain-containing protein [Rhodospirillaceae bacterium]|nr:EAL domain-containing protein [Rhodospirillaceae bacterium]
MIRSRGYGAGRLRLAAMLLAGFVVVAGYLWFTVVEHDRQRTAAAVESWQQVQLQMARDAAESVRAWVTGETLRDGDSADRAADEAARLFIAPMQLLDSGHAQLYRHDRVQGEWRRVQTADDGRAQASLAPADFPWPIERPEAAREVADVSAAEGIGTIADPAGGDLLVAAWSSLDLGDAAWTISIMTPRSEVLEHARVGDELARETVATLVTTLVLAILFFSVWRQDRARGLRVATLQETQETLEQRVEERTKELSAVNTALRDENLVRRSAEERLALRTAESLRQTVLLTTVVQRMRQGLAVFDADRSLLLCNDRYRSLLDLPEALTQPGTLYEDIVHWQADNGEFGEVDWDEAWPPRLQRIEEGEMARWVRRRANGRWLEFSRDPMPEGGFITLLSDITVQKRSEIELAENVRKFRAMFTQHAAIMYLVDPASLRIMDVNQAAEAFYGYTRQEFLNRTALDLTTVPLDELRQEMARAPEPGRMVRSERHRLADGEIRDVEVRSTPIPFGNGKELHFEIVQDVTDRRRAEENLHKLSQAVEQSPASVIIADLAGRIEYVNSTFVAITGYRPHEVLGKGLEVLTSGYMTKQASQELWSAVLAGREWRGEVHSRTKDGALFWEYALIAPIRAADGRITHVLQVREDVTQRKELEDQQRRQATYDELTQLPNRMLALDRLEGAIGQCHRLGQKLALLMVDLDNFQAINDTFGHESGDTLLKQAALRLGECLREGDTVARMGSDDFLIILPALSDPVRAEVVAKRILDSFSSPFFVQAREVFATASVGITIFPLDGNSPQAMIRNAAAAMQRAKESGRNSFQFFTPELNAAVSERIQLESRLRRALDRGELSLYYQPIVETGSGRVHGAEALLRWRNDEVGEIPPTQFIPLAEETGLILRIGEWALREACRQGQAWREQGMALAAISVNVSSRQFAQGTVAAVIERVLADTGLPANNLELEVTENLLLDETADVAQQLRKLQEMGVRLAIDDFGTGYSALGYLKRYRFNALKIDRSFVRDVPRNPDDRKLIEAIVAMAHGLGLRVVAEGVETPEQLAFLRSRHCDLAQGYFLAPPAPAADFPTGSLLSVRLPPDLHAMAD